MLVSFHGVNLLPVASVPCVPGGGSGGGRWCGCSCGLDLFPQGCVVLCFLCRNLEIGWCFSVVFFVVVLLLLVFLFVCVFLLSFHSFMLICLLILPLWPHCFDFALAMLAGAGLLGLIHLRFSPGCVQQCEKLGSCLMSSLALCRALEW